AIITLNYTQTVPLPASFSLVTPVTLGDQTAAQGSFLVTAGEAVATDLGNYADAPPSVDLSLVALDATGTVRTDNSGLLWLVAPSLRSSLGLTVALLVEREVYLLASPQLQMVLTLLPLLK
ncbi:MAG TPA: hypothetical protein VK766_04050, partial [Cytophagaceae bacterium]|nr:hypothetical protein [Cytophagaceae bacterium]